MKNLCQEPAARERARPHAAHQGRGDGLGVHAQAGQGRADGRIFGPDEVDLHAGERTHDDIVSYSLVIH